MRLPVLTEQTTSDVHGTKVVSCSRGTVLMSCGIDNVDASQSGGWDLQR